MGTKKRVRHLTPLTMDISHVETVADDRAQRPILIQLNLRAEAIFAPSRDRFAFALLSGSLEMAQAFHI
jgi:hypothetical protein